MTRVRRSVGVLLVALALGLTGCSSVATDQGQQRIDDALTAAGLSDQVTATYSCTGALPGRVDHCNTRLQITTDDFGVVERASAVPELADARLELDYDGVSADLALVDAPILLDVLAQVPDGTALAFVDLSRPDQPHIGLADTATVAQGCALAESLLEDFTRMGVAGGVAGNELSWVIRPSGDDSPVLDQACAVIGEFVATADLDGVDRIEYSTAPKAQLIEVRTSTDEAAAGIEAWFAGRTDLAPFSVRVS